MTRKHFFILLLITAGALLVHGYHPYIEDAEIYIPEVKKALNPVCYPFNSQFFHPQARWSLFPQLIAGSIRTFRLPVDWALFAWQVLSIFLLLLGCLRIGRQCFRHSTAQWGATVLVAALLTVPVAGTSLYIMDQYLTARSLSTAAVILAIADLLERKWLKATFWIGLTALIHPLMAVFAITYLATVAYVRRQEALAYALLLLPVGFPFAAASDAYREASGTRTYLFLLQWQWYEWLGIFAPLALLWWFQRVARKQDLPVLGLLCRALIVFSLFFFVVALAITVPPYFRNLIELQPMRSLHLLYVLLFIFTGGLLARFVLRDRVWRWLLLFAPLCAGMWLVQRQLLPATTHIEWPGIQSNNDWVRAFLWIRQNTPQDAYFALDPHHMDVPGEDEHGFRALAERSRLADGVKDPGAVTLYPPLAEEWRSQVHALRGWANFQVADFKQLRQRFGVNWVVLQPPGVSGMSCPYQNNTVMVCRIE